MNSGNSGGPLINSYGQVIGINSVKITSSYYTSVEGLGFAIPITEAKIIINDLINVGYVTGRPSLGIFCQEIDAMTARFNNLPQGIYVVSVNEGGAGDKAGIKAEDVIIGIQGQPITTYTEFNAIKNQYKVGDKITITVSRKNRDIDLEVVLEEASR
jgi:serine protease Do